MRVSSVLGVCNETLYRMFSIGVWDPIGVLDL